MHQLRHHYIKFFKKSVDHLLLDVRPLDRIRPVSPNSFVRPESVDRSHFFTVEMRALASPGAKKLSKVTTLCRFWINKSFLMLNVKKDSPRTAGKHINVIQVTKATLQRLEHGFHVSWLNNHKMYLYVLYYM